VISAVDLIKGIGILAGLVPVEVENVTGTIHTNFSGKADAAINELISGKDFVYLHMEAPDECSHQGDVKNKVRSIEIIDRKVVKVIKEALDRAGFDYKMMVLPDHSTPIRLRTHTSEPVPFLIYNNTSQIDNALGKFDELSAKKTGLYFKEGYKLADYLIRNFN